MFMTVDANDARPLYLQIVDEVRRALVLGTLAVGDPLPSVRQLAGELRVNPNTISQAYRELEREGVVEVRRGQGTFVAKMDGSASQRRTLARGVAARALRDAFRNGLSVEELIHAVRTASSIHSR